MNFRSAAGAAGGRVSGPEPAAPPGPPKATLAHGPFQIELGTRRVPKGTFPNQGGSPFATREVSEFRLRHRGEPVVTEGGNDRLWRVLRLVDAPRPALLLVTSGFVLATEDAAGRLQLTPIRNESSSLAELQWLDSRDGQPGPAQTFGIESLKDAQIDTLLSGGRWLRLGSRSVMDVATLTVHGVAPWRPEDHGTQEPELMRNGDLVRAFSPGRTAYVLDASGYDHTQSSARVMRGLLLVNILSGVAHPMRTDRKRMRFADTTDRDADWVHHHFTWQTDAQGTERLVAREHFQPWPWRARRHQPQQGRWSLTVPRIDAAFLPVIKPLLTEAAGGAAPVDATSTSVPGFRITVDGCELNAHAFGSVESGPDSQYVSIWPRNEAVSGPDAPACEPALRRLAALINAELASGRHDALIKLDE